MNIELSIIRSDQKTELLGFACIWARRFGMRYPSWCIDKVFRDFIRGVEFSAESHYPYG
jgi:hypothetical protein